MDPIKAILIDDEASARENLTMLLQRFCKQVQVLDTFDNLPDGVGYLETHEVDLVFLDVDMPNYAGYEIAKFIKHIDFQIVFVTAYDKYAIKAFELAATDYLLKPIDVQRLQEAVDRVAQKLQNNPTGTDLTALTAAMNEADPNQLCIYDQGVRKFIPFRSIVAIEAEGAYSKLYIEDGTEHTVSKNMAKLEAELEASLLFFRSHRSWLINLSYVKELKNSTYQIILSNGLTAKVSRYQMADFKAIMSH